MLIKSNQIKKKSKVDLKATKNNKNKKKKMDPQAKSAGVTEEDDRQRDVNEVRVFLLACGLNHSQSRHLSALFCDKSLYSIKRFLAEKRRGEEGNLKSILTAVCGTDQEDVVKLIDQELERLVALEAEQAAAFASFSSSSCPSSSSSSMRRGNWYGLKGLFTCPFMATIGLIFFLMIMVSTVSIVILTDYYFGSKRLISEWPTYIMSFLSCVRRACSCVYNNQDQQQPQQQQSMVAKIAIENSRQAVLGEL